MSFVIKQAAGGSAPIDVTPYLLDDQPVRLEQEFERGAFNPVYDDITVRFDNSQGNFFAYFASSSARTEWRLLVSAPETGRLVFEGTFTIHDVKYTLESENVVIRSFHLTRAFWELAGTQRRTPAAPKDGMETREFVTVQYFLARNLARAPFAPFYFDALDCGVYGDRPIRGWSENAADRSLKGRAADLLFETTVAELLTAFEKYYNAVFLIDHETRTLHMLPRNGALRDLRTPIPRSLLMENGDAVLVPVDEAKVDYVYTFFGIPAPGKPQFSSSTRFAQSANSDAGLSPGAYRWRMTYVLSYTDGAEAGEIETAGGEALELVFAGSAAERFAVELFLPQSELSTAQKVLGRRLYRTRANEENEYYLLLDVPGNSGAFVTDSYNDAAWTKTLDIYSGEQYREHPSRYKILFHRAHGVAKAGGYCILAGHAVNGIDVGGQYRILDTLGGESSDGLVIDLDVSGARYGGESGAAAGAGGSVTLNFRAPLPADVAAVKAWIGWDDEAGAWRDPVYDAGNGMEPAGLIFNVQPELRFMVSATNTAPREADAADIFNFFGAEADLAAVRTQWQEMMQTLRRATFSAAGTSYRTGDTITCDFLPAHLTRNRTLRIVKCSNDFSSETTTIEALV